MKRKANKIVKGLEPSRKLRCLSFLSLEKNKLPVGETQLRLTVKEDERTPQGTAG